MTTPRRLHSDGTTYHVRIRGIDGRPIFRDDVDREKFLGILDRTLPAQGACALQWALIPNHAHLKLKVAQTPLSILMHAVDTEYARHFNERHASQGHVFQDRYWRKAVHDGAYGAALSGYVPGNVVDARLAEMDNLDRYPWCGYGAVMGTLPARAFHRVDLELATFSRNPELARDAIRSATWEAVERMRTRRAGVVGVLGDIVQDVCLRHALELDELRRGRTKRAEEARCEAIRRAILAGIPKMKVASGLGINRITVYRHTRPGPGSDRTLSD